jgi:ATP/maltotriose-dependent transcriptional regulator MalT
VAEAAGYHFILCWIQIILAIIYQEQGYFATVRQVTERALHLAEEHSFHMAAACATMQRGWIAFLTGGWEAARRDLEAAVAMGRAIGPFFASVYLPLSLASLSLAEGKDEEAAHHLEQCGHLQRTGGDDQASHLAARVRATRDLLAGHPGVACGRLAPLLAPGAMEQDAAPVQAVLAWAHLAQGEIGEAAELAQRAMARAREQGMQVLLVEALRVAALVAAGQGRLQEADGMLQEGLSLARRLGYPYAEALLLQASGEVCAQLGQPESGRERLEAAQAMFRRLGARMDSERIAGLLSCW